MTVVWITGLPSSGKSTIAERLREQLVADKRSAVVLDSDDVRRALGWGEYSAAARDDFYRALAELAALIARQGPCAIVAATAPARAHREFARSLSSNFIEVFVDTPLAECMRRDVKGLYAAAQRDEMSTLPGSGIAYQRPRSPDVIAHGGLDEVAVAAIAKRIGT